MRLFAKLSLVFVLALAVFLLAPDGRRFLFPPKTGRGKSGRQEQRVSAKSQEAADEQTKTNPPPDGFFLGKGDQRTYVQYATPDPILRSFMQSVMDGSSDPNTKGKEIFLKICAACHQPDGAGKEGLAPPLAGSEWVLAPGGDRLVRIVLNGLTGKIQVRGKDWNLAMPPLRENLSDDQIAVVLTYVRSQVADNHAGLLAPELAAAARKETRAKPETSEELLRISDQ